jgi:hypothetical protein
LKKCSFWRVELQLAKDQGRILISHDENTMPRHSATFSPMETVIESILLIWIASRAEEWIHRVVWLLFKSRI